MAELTEEDLKTLDAEYLANQGMRAREQPSPTYRAQAGVAGWRDDAKPDESATALALSKESGIPPAIIDADVPGWTKIMQQERDRAIIAKNPQLARFLAQDEMAVKTSIDDLGPLDKVMNSVKNYWEFNIKYNPLYMYAKLFGGITTGEIDAPVAAGIGQAAKKGFSSAEEAVQYTDLVDRYKAGDKSLLPQIEAIEKRREEAAGAETGESAAEHVANLFGTFAGMMAYGSPEAFKYGTATMAATAPAWAPVAAASGPAAPAVAFLGAGGTFLTGAFTGYAMEAGRQATAQTWRNIDKIRDVDGNPIDDKTKYWIAFAAGTTTALGSSVLGANSGRLAVQAWTKILGNKAAEMAITTAITGAVIEAGQGGGINATTTLATALAAEFGKHVSGYDIPTAMNDPAIRAQILNDTVQSFIDGTILSGTLAGVTMMPTGRGWAGRGTVTDKINQNNAIANAGALGEIVANGDMTKLKARSPELYQRAIGEALKIEESGLTPDVHVPAAIIAANRDLFPYITDAQIIKAETIGSEITIPTDRFLSAPGMNAETYIPIAPFIRQGDASYNPAEAQAALTTAAQQAQNIIQAAPALEAPTTAMMQLGLPGIIPDQMPTPEQIMSQVFGSIREMTPEQLAAAPAAVQQGINFITEQNAERILQGIKRPQQLAQEGAAVAQQLDLSLPEPQALPQPLAVGAIATRLLPAERSPVAQTPADVAAAVKEDKANLTAERDKLIDAIDFDKAVQATWGVRPKPTVEPTPAREPKGAPDYTTTVPRDQRGLITPEDLAQVELMRRLEFYKETDPLINIVVSGAPDMDFSMVHHLLRDNDTYKAVVNQMILEKMQAEGAVRVAQLKDPDARHAAMTTGTLTDRQRNLMWLSPIIQNASTVQMKPSQFNTMARHLMELQRYLTQGVLDAAWKVVEKKETETWKNNSKLLEPVVTDQLMNRPPDQAWESLRTGYTKDTKLNQRLTKKEVDSLFSKDELREFGVKRASDLLPNWMFRKKGRTVGVADDMATMWGFGSGKEMVRELANLNKELTDLGETFDQRITRQMAEEVNRQMVKKYGDLDVIIMREAIDASLNDKQLDVLVDEIKVLGQQATRESIKAEATRNMSTMTVAEASRMEKFQRSAGDHGKLAEQAFLKNDMITAAKEKQFQAIQYEMAKQARELNKQVKATDKLRNQYTKNARVEAVSGEYNAVILQFLYESGVPEGVRDRATLERDMAYFHQIRHGSEPVPTNFIEWRKLNEASGDLTSTPLNLLNGRADPSQFTVEDFQSFAKTLKELDYQGRRLNKYVVAGQALEFGEVKNSVMEPLKDLSRWEKFRDDIAQVGKEARKARRRASRAGLTKVEALFDMIQGKDKNGPLSRYIFNPLKAGQYQYETMERELNRRLYSVARGENERTWQNNIENKLLQDESGAYMPLRRIEMEALALNAGNENTLKKMIDGFGGEERGWTRDNVMTILRDSMSEQNWKWVRNVWETNNWIQEQKDRAYRELRGTGLKRAEATTLFDDRFSSIQGGHYPELYSRAFIGDPRGDAVIMNDSYFKGMDPDDFDTKRKEAPAPERLMLDTAYLAHAMKRELWDVAMREKIMEANKILGDKDFLKGIKDAFGQEYADLIPTWVQDVTNNGGWRDHRAAEIARQIERWGYFARIAILGFNVKTAAIHGTGVAFQTIADVGPVNAMKSTLSLLGEGGAGLAWYTFDKIFSNPTSYEKYMTEAYRKSGELKHRARSRLRDTRYVLGEERLFERSYKRYDHISMMMLGTLDYASAAVAWHASYNMALRDGLGENAAIQWADKAVRDTHGATSTLDLSAAQRNPGLRPFMMFYSTFNHMYNQIAKRSHYARLEWEEARDAVHKEGLMGPGAAKFLTTQLKTFVYVVTYLGAGIVMHEALKERDETKEGSALGFAVKAGINGITSMLGPVGRTMGHEATSGFTSFPVGEAVASVPKTFWKWADFIHGKKDVPPIKDTVTTLGFTMGLGSRQIGKWLGGTYNIAAGYAPPPQNFPEYWRLFLHGRAKYGAKMSQSGSSYGVPKRNRNKPY